MTISNFVAKLFLGSSFCYLFTACAAPQAPTEERLIKTDHLNHLYEEVAIDGVELGTIWIYCEAPDYHLVADEDEGFTCVDDVARALVFYCRQYKLTPSSETLAKIRGLTEFLLYMQAENGFYYNFLLPGPQVNKTHQNSQAIANWWSWRAFWALTEVNQLEVAELSAWQSRSRPVMDTLIRKMENLCSSWEDTTTVDGISMPVCLTQLGADQVGVIMIGLANYYQLNPSERVKSLLLSFGNLLLHIQQGDTETWPHYAIMSWLNYWHAWGNVQGYALLYAGRILQEEAFIQAGLNEVRFFYPYCIKEGFISGFKVLGVGDSLVQEDYRQFSQIAYNIRPMVFAALEAYAITGDTIYVTTAVQLASWFFGNNPAKQQMYDPTNGRTFDGLSSPTELNRNSGAESTIEALLSLQALEAIPAGREALNSYLQH